MVRKKQIKACREWAFTQDEIDEIMRKRRRTAYLVAKSKPKKKVQTVAFKRAVNNFQEFDLKQGFVKERKYYVDITKKLFERQGKPIYK
jgi:hypothetical protein